MPSSLWGALSLVKEPQVTWPDSDVELLQAIADQLTVAIVQVSLYQRLQRELSSRQQMEQVLRHSAMPDALTDQLGLLAVAEGIETADHLDLLRSIGCEQGQGYYFAKPLPAFSW